MGLVRARAPPAGDAAPHPGTAPGAGQGEAGGGTAPEGVGRRGNRILRVRTAVNRHAEAAVRPEVRDGVHEASDALRSENCRNKVASVEVWGCRKGGGGDGGDLGLVQRY